MRITLRGFIHLCIAAPMIEGGQFVLLLLALISFCFVRSVWANFPADPQSKRAKQQKALTGGQSLLALTDQDEAWGKWKPSDSRSSKDTYYETGGD